MRKVHLLVLTSTAVLSVGLVAYAQAPMPEDKAPDYTAADEKILRDLNEKVDGPGLLEYFRKRTYPEVNPKHVETLLTQLGAAAFRAREKAHAELIGLGASCLAQLRVAEQSANHEVRRRALDIRRRIERKSDTVAEAAAARLVAVRKPAGAAPVLLDFLPFAADDAAVDEICQALPAVARSGGKAEPAVLAALKDKLAIKRAAAGVALIKAGAAEELPAVRALLQDAEPLVQVRIAHALVTKRHEKEPVAKLIAALGQLPPEQLWQAEELLIRLAGEKAPQVSLGADAEGRQKCRQAWGEWWAAAKDDVDLSKLKMGKAFLNYTLVVQRSFNRIVKGKRMLPGFQVLELDAGKEPRVRWKIDVTTYPVHAEVVGPDRVLIAEYQGMKVSERDFKGAVRWEKAVGGNPLAVQRLTNGNTFVVMQNRLVEYDRKGTEVYHMDRPTFDIFRARKVRNGDVVFITAQGVLTRLNPRTNKVVRTFNVGQMGSQFGSFEVLPNGNYLIPVYTTQEVIEFDANGKRLKSAKAQWPTSAQRLPNGNTLIGSQINRRVIELDRTGREVWAYDAGGQVFMVRRR